MFALEDSHWALQIKSGYAVASSSSATYFLLSYNIKYADQSASSDNQLREGMNLVYLFLTFRHLVSNTVLGI